MSQVGIALAMNVLTCILLESSEVDATGAAGAGVGVAMLLRVLAPAARIPAFL